jgi:hypothetical protein
MIYAQIEISLDQQLPKNPPEGWEALKDKILSFSHDIDATWRGSGHGKMGLFIEVSDERIYIPLSILKRIQNCEYLFSVLLTSAESLICYFLLTATYVLRPMRGYL